MGLTVHIVCILVAFCVGKIFFHLKKYSRLWKQFKKVPTVFLRPLPFVGHAIVLQGNPEDMYERAILSAKEILIDKGHEIGYIWLGMTPLLVVVGPKAAEELIHGSKHLEKSSLYNFIHTWLGTGLLTAKGEKWKTRRKLLTPTFHFSILQDYLEVMNEQAKVFAEKLGKYAASGETFDVSHPTALCALDIICETAMGRSINAQNNRESEYVNAISRATEVFQERQKSPWLWPDFIFNLTKIGKQYAEYLNVLHTFTKSVIKDRMEDLCKKTVQPKMKRLAFLDLLLTALKDGNLSDIQEEVDTFMFEGHDTTASALTWVIHLIGSHPDVQEKILQEVDDVLGSDRDKVITTGDVGKLEYMELVIKESLRLFPSVPIIGRKTSCECILDGCTIPAGTECLILTQLINSNKHYWSDPDKFEPERFRKENSAGRHPYSYLPFSAGPRNCIGQKFALMEEKVVLAYFFRRYRVEAMDETDDIWLKADVILRSDRGINIQITERNL